MWNQEQAVAFECAREVITEMMGILTFQINEYSKQAEPNPAHLKLLRADRSRLAAERASLHVGQDEKIAQVREKYGSFIRQFRGDKRVIEA